jgi:hypothetical protein
LANPQDLICNNATQEVHVLDDAEIVYGRTNPRIVVFSFNGTYLRSFNLSSSFSSVTSIGRSQLSGNFFVGTLQSKLLTYDATGAMIGVTNLTSAGQFSTQAQFIALDDNEYVYTCPRAVSPGVSVWECGNPTTTTTTVTTTITTVRTSTPAPATLSQTSRPAGACILAGLAITALVLALL